MSLSISSSTSQTPIIPLSSVSGVTSAISVLNLKGIFDDLSARVNAVITSALENAGNAGNQLLIQAGMEVNSAIQNAKNAFEDSMEKTLNDIKGKGDDLINRLSLLVSDLEKKEETILRQLQETAISIVSMLPFANQQTQFKRVTPQYVAIMANDTSVKVSMAGLFFFTATQTPTLKIGEHTARILQTSRERIDFEVPVSALIPSGQTNVKSFSYVGAVFNAPWEQTEWVIFKKVHQAAFNIWLGLLPSSPGDLTVNFEATSQGRIQQSRQSSSYRYYGVHDGGDTHVTTPHYPTAGWKFSGTPQIVYESRGGYIQLQSSVMSPTGDNFVVTFVLGGGDWDNVGQLAYHIVWDEYQQVQNKQQRTEVISDLFWGNEIMIKPAENERILDLSLKAFNGHNFVFFPQTDTSNPFIKLFAQEGKVIVKANVPEESDLSFSASQTALVQGTTHVALKALRSIQASYVHGNYLLNEQLKQLESTKIERENFFKMREEMIEKMKVKWGEARTAEAFATLKSDKEAYRVEFNAEKAKIAPFKEAFSNQFSLLMSQHLPQITEKVVELREEKSK